MLLVKRPHVAPWSISMAFILRIFHRKIVKMKYVYMKWSWRASDSLYRWYTVHSDTKFTWITDSSNHKKVRSWHKIKCENMRPGPASASGVLIMAPPSLYLLCAVNPEQWMWSLIRLETTGRNETFTEASYCSRERCWTCRSLYITY